jgi:branched-subunit amino acid ABC-type transport system permease component
MIILGVVDVINLAHGELIMLGAYTATLAYHRAHLPLPLCVVVSALGVGAFGGQLVGRPRLEHDRGAADRYPEPAEAARAVAGDREHAQM